MSETNGAGVLTSDLAGFKEEDGCPEDLRQVGAMDLVEDKERLAVLRQPRRFDEPARANAESKASRRGVR